MSGTLAASRSAKKIWRWAFDWSPATSSRNSCRSRVSASAIGSVRAPRSASTAAAGAFCPFARLMYGAAAASKTAISWRACAGLSSRSRTSRSGRRSAAARRANATAAVRRSPVTTSSTRPASCASAAPIGSPERIIAMALSMPTSRGSRCVPPAPGMMPSLISGSPRRVSGAATRKWQASASSSPPPSGVPCRAATIGLPMASIVAMTLVSTGSRGGLPNSAMSAPATKVRPAQAITIADTAASPPARTSTSCSAARTPWLSALTGGLAMVTIATSPSYRKSARSGNRCAPQVVSAFCA